jgi:hypothetical protein
MAGMVPVQAKVSGPDFKMLGITPGQVIDLLAALKVDGQPVITDDRAFADPSLKAQAVLEYFNKNFGISPTELPHLASVIKQDLRQGRIDWEG